MAVAQQIARKLVKGKGLAQLLSRPLRGRVRGNVFRMKAWWLCQWRVGRNFQMAGSSSPRTQEQKPWRLFFWTSW